MPFSSKAILLCSDYRKVVIMMYVALEEIDPHSPLTDVFRTAAEINEILYSKSEKRDRRQILRFHNITFVHCMICREVFSDLVKVSRKKPIFPCNCISCSNGKPNNFTKLSIY